MVAVNVSPHVSEHNASIWVNGNEKSWAHAGASQMLNPIAPDPAGADPCEAPQTVTARIGKVQPRERAA